MPRVKAKVDLTQDIKRVEEGLDSIIHQQPCKHDFNSLYSSTDKIINNDTPDKLLNLLKQKIDEEITKWEKELSEEKTSNSLLVLFSLMYNKFKIYSDIIPKVYNSYDFKSAPEKKSKLIIRSYYDAKVISNKSVINHVIEALIKQIDYFRDTPTDTNYSVAKNIVDCFYDFTTQQHPHFNTLVDNFIRNIYEYFSGLYDSRETVSPVKYTTDCNIKFKLEENILNAIFKKADAELALEETAKALFNDMFLFDITCSYNVAELLNCENTELLDWLNKLLHKYISDLCDSLVTLLCNYIKRRMISFKAQFEDHHDKGNKGDEEHGSTETKKTKTVVVKKKAASEKKEDKETDEKAPAEKKTTKRVIKRVVVSAKTEDKEGNDETEEKAKVVTKKAKAKSKAKNDTKIEAMKDLIFTTYNLYTKFKNIFREESAAKLVKAAIEEAWNIKEFRPQTNFVHFIHYYINANLENIPQEFQDKSKFAKLCRRFYEFTYEKTDFLPLFMNYQIQRIINSTRGGSQDTREYEFELVKEFNALGANSCENDFGKHLNLIYEQVKDSIDTTDKFKAQMPKLDFDFQATMLNQDIVNKLATNSKFVISDFLSIHNEFTNFYVKIHPNNDLRIIPDMTQLTFTFVVPSNKNSPTPKVYNIKSDAWGGSILYTIFMAKEHGTRQKDICAKLNIDSDEIIRFYINQMYHMKLITNKEKKKDIEIDDIIWIINKDFYNEQKYVIIQTIDKQSEKASDHSKKHKIDQIKLALIKVGKQNSEGLSKDSLIEQAIKILKKYFTPDSIDINTTLDQMCTGLEKYFKISPDGMVYYQK